MLNQFLGGHYRIVQALGEGGLAKTYIAEDHHRPGNPKCAVKFLKPASNNSNFLPTARRLFKKEAEILEQLGRHDQIPRLLAYFEENKQFYIIQEFIEGHTLGAEIHPGSCWSENKVLLMLQDVLQILEFVHSFGVIHRDIKPNNLIRRDKDGRLVLIDFGAVKQVSNPRITSQLQHAPKTISIGTQGYAPTEQVRGKPRFNSDIYALGMISIQALTGIEPLKLPENDQGEVLWRNRAEVSDQLALILNNMVRYHFRERYQSSTEVLQDLKSFVDQDSSIPITSETFFESKSSETKVFLGINSPDSEVVSEAELENTKIAPELNQPSSELPSFGELQQTEDSLEMDSWGLWSSPAVSKTKIRKTRKSIGINYSDLSGVSEVGKEKITLSIKQPNTRVINHTAKKLSLFSAAVSLASALYLKLSHSSFLVSFNKSRLLLGTGIVFSLLGFYASAEYIRHQQSYSMAQQDLEQIESLKLAKKYEQCVQLALVFPQNLPHFKVELNNLVHDCYEGHLNKAKKLAEQSRLQEAIALAIQIPQDMNVYLEAQQLISAWSEKIFQIASNKYHEGNLEEALAIAGAIPTESSLITKLEVTVEQWNKNWQKNQTYLHTAQKDLDRQNWQDAINEAKKVKDNDFWQQKSQEIIQQAEAEIAAAQTTVINTDNSGSSSVAPSNSTSPGSSSNSSVSNSIPPSSSAYPRYRPIKPSSSIPPRYSSISPPSSTLPNYDSIPSSNSNSSSPRSNRILCLNKHSHIPKCMK